MNLPEYVEQLYGELGNMHELKILQGFGFVVNCLTIIIDEKYTDLVH